MFLFAKNKQLSGIYILYIISLILNVVPNIILSSFGSVLFFVIFIVTFIFKLSSPKDSVEYSHYAYLIKTIGIFALFVFIGIIFAYYLGDHTIINNMMTSAINGMVPDINNLSSIIMDYTHVNKYIFGIIFLPITIYLFYRLGKGLYLARKNEKVFNLKSWI